MAKQQAIVLDKFKQLRGQILEVLDEGKQLAQSLGPIQGEIENKFATAHKAVDLSRLNLVVIGAEGNGKSTLINSILGEDLTPREEQEPGTVAPVYLEWSPDQQPVYSVMLDGKDKPVICSADAFGSYLLQKKEMNPNNEKKVLSGTISHDHPLLEKGLRLTDMPGVEGVSSAIAMEAQRFIKKEAHAVLAVAKERTGYGALVRTLHEIEGDKIKVQAVVSNWPLDPWIGKPDEVLRDFVRSQKEILSALLEEECQVQLAPSQVFVLHLPSFCEAQSGGMPQVTSPVHQQESEAFVSTVWDYVKSHGLFEVVTGGTGKAEEALGELRGLLDIRLNVLKELIDGDASARDELVGSLKEALSSAEQTWKKLYNDKNIEEIASATWNELKPELDDMRDRMLEKVHQIKDQVDKKEGKIRKTEAKDIRAKLQKIMAAEFSHLQEEQERLLKQVADRYCTHANHVLEQLFQDVPVIQQTVGGIKLSTQGLIAYQLSTMEPGLQDKLLKAGAVGTLSSIGGAVAGGGGALHVLVGAAGLGPIGAAIAGAIGGGLLAWGLINWLRDEHRPAVLKGLEKCKTDIQAIDTSKSGKLHVTWGEAVAGVARSVDKYLESQINNIVQIINDPTSDMDRLTKQKQKVDESVETVDNLLKRLTAIGSVQH